MYLILLLFKFNSQADINSTSRIDSREVTVPGAVVPFVEDILDTDTRFEDKGIQVERVACVQIPLLVFRGVTVCA